MTAAKKWAALAPRLKWGVADPQDLSPTSLSISKITTGVLTAAISLAGSLKTALTGKRLELDSNGLRLYDNSNALVVDLNSATGSANFTGTVTATSIISTFTGVQEAHISTLESTTSTSYVDLATVGPFVDVTIGPSGQALVFTSVTGNNDTATTNVAITSFGHYVSGSSGTFIEALDTNAAVSYATVGTCSAGRAVLATGLTPGSQRFKLRYKGSTGAGPTYSFSNRHLVVVPL